jgi:phosphate transport system substrate-binding protein
MRKLRLIAVLVMLLCLITGCTASRRGLTVAGSTSVLLMADMLAEAYTRAGGSRVAVHGVGSTAGVQAVQSGVADVGMISRRLAPSESAQGMVEHIIAYDVLAVVVHPDNPLAGRSMSVAQLRKLYSGAATDWAQLGGRKGSVHLISRESGSGSKDAFQTVVGKTTLNAIVLNASGMITIAVESDPNAIAYLSLGVARAAGLGVLALDGRQPEDPDYPLRRAFSFVTRGPAAGEAAAFIRFARSRAGQQVITEEGLVPVRE